MGIILLCSKPKWTARNLMKCSEASSQHRTSSKSDIVLVSVSDPLSCLQLAKGGHGSRRDRTSRHHSKPTKIHSESSPNPSRITLSSVPCSRGLKHYAESIFLNIVYKYIIQIIIFYHIFDRLLDRMFSAGPSCKGKVTISLGFSFAFQRGRKVRGQTHGKNHEGKQQAVQTIGRKNSDIPHHENREYLHYFENFGKQNWYREYTPYLALFRLFITSRLWPPQAAAHLLGHA